MIPSSRSSTGRKINDARRAWLNFVRGVALEYLDVDPERPTKDQYAEIAKCVKTFSKSRWNKERNQESIFDVRVFKSALFQYWNKHRRLYKSADR